jgi:hypothetical protein
MPYFTANELQRGIDAAVWLGGDELQSISHLSSPTCRYVQLISRPIVSDTLL